MFFGGRRLGGGRVRARRDEDDDDSSGSSVVELSESGTPKQKKGKLEDDLSKFKDKVHHVLKKVTDTLAGEFAISQLLPHAPNVVISITDGRKIRFPLYEEDLDQITDSFEMSPYGKGTETILDPSFRNSWELSPDKFTILNPGWDIFITETLIPIIAKDFYIKSPFVASLYKLLLYKEGSFFKSHRDSEKEPGMFATLVIQLPSKYTGGQLIVNHDNKSKTIDFSSTPDKLGAEFSTSFSAFYCDCQHEILPLTSGVRICLVYNLCLTGQNPRTLLAPVTSTAEVELSALLQEWRDMGNIREPSKIVYALTHKYTQKNLSFDNLKSTDQVVAKLLKQVAQNSMTILLAIFEKTTSGQLCDYDDDFDSNDEDYCHEKEYCLNNLKMLEQTASATVLKDMNSLSVEPEFEVIPENCWESIQPYNTEKEETGNEGVNISLFYRHVALVIFPAENILEVLLDGDVGLGRSDNMTVAENLFIKEFEQTRGVAREVKMEAKLRKWADRLVKGGSYARADSTNAVALLSAISSFNDCKLLQEFLKSRNGITPAKIPILLIQLDKHGWKSLTPQVTEMFTKCAKGNSGNGLEMLRIFINSSNPSADRNLTCASLAQVVLDNLCNRTTQTSSWYYSHALAKTPAQKKAEVESDQKLIHDFYLAVKEIGFDITSYTESKPLGVMVPVILKLAPTEGRTDNWKELAKILLKRMEEIKAKPGARAPSWSRNDFKPCSSCTDCASLLAFMLSNKVSMGFKVAKQRRQHLHQRLNSMSDVKHETERSGSPQTLVVTKTDKIAGDLFADQQLVAELLPKLQEAIRASAQGQTS